MSIERDVSETQECVSELYNNFVLFSIFSVYLHSDPLSEINSEKVKACEKSGGGRTTIIAVVLYFFLLWDAPRSPSVLIGSGGLLCAGRLTSIRPEEPVQQELIVPVRSTPSFTQTSLLQMNLIYV